MDFAEARTAFFQPRAQQDTRALPYRSAARRLRDAVEPIGALSFWADPVHQEYAGLGLDFLQGYVWSRACVLGEPDAGVVVAAFGVFEPGLITDTYHAARAACGLDAIRAARANGALAAMDQVGADGEGLADAVTALRRGLDAADGAGRALFAGLSGLDWPASPAGALWHAATLLREYRGDSHLAACVAAGLTGLEANILTELWIGWEPLAYSATRGWPPEQLQRAQQSLQARGLATDDALTAAGVALREGIEQATDAAMAPVVDAIGADLDATVAVATDVADRILAAGWFPPDPYKRAAG